MAVPYTFATATSAIPLSQLDSNFATAITLGSTSLTLGTTTTTVVGLTLTSPTLTTPALGTPSSGTLTNCTGYPSSAISGTISLTTQVTGTLPVANGGTGVTTSTGTGSVVLSTSPTFVTPILGTPTSGTLTNTTGFPAANLAGTALPAAIVTSSLTALGTIATGTWNGSIITGTYGGTGVNNGSNTITIAGNLTHAGAFTQSFTATANTAVTLPAGATAASNNLLSSATAVGIVTGTPSSTTYLRGDGTWATVAAQTYPGAGIANSTGTAWGTSYSTTGSGTVVALATSPTLVTPVLGTPTSGNLSNCTADGTNSVGFLNIPINSQSAAYTLVLADAGKAILHPSTDANARTFTIPANSSVAYPVGTAISFINMTSNVVSIAITTDTMYLSSAGTTGTRSLAQYGTATAIKMTSTTWIISGSGLT